MKTDQRIVVVGKAGLAPKGMRYCPWDQSYWDRLIYGGGSIRPHPMEGVHERLKVKVSSRFDDGELDPLIDELPRELTSRLTPPIKHCDRVIQLAILTAWYALRDAGIPFGPRYENIGVEIGTGLGGGRTNEEKILKYQLDGLAHKTDMFTVPNVMPNGPASQISIVFKLCGPVNGDVAACTSAKNAFINAVRILLCGDADVMVTGGVEAVGTDYQLRTFDVMGALTRELDFPSQPFGANRSGFVMGEGGTIFVLTSEGYAREQDLKIQAYVLGYSELGDGANITQPDPDGVIRAMTLCIEKADISPNMVDLICAHGTSTPLNDKTEALACRAIWGGLPTIGKQPVPHVTGNKSRIGHTLGASGGFNILTNLLIMETGLAPGLGDYELAHDCLWPESESHPDLPALQAPIPFVGKTRRVNAKITLSNSFGFGGHNGCVALGLS